MSDEQAAVTYRRVTRSANGFEIMKKQDLSSFVAGQGTLVPGADLGGGCRRCAPPPEMTCGFLIQLVFCQTMWFIGVEVEQEKSAPPPKKNPGSAPAL